MGVVTHHHRMTAAASMIAGHSGVSQEDMIRGLISDILGVMPKGTRYISGEIGTIADLSIPITLKFEHPIFPDGTQIDLEYHRATNVAGEGDDARVVQANVLTGIYYHKPDGTRMFTGGL